MWLPWLLLFASSSKLLWSRSDFLFPFSRKIDKRLESALHLLRVKDLFLFKNIFPTARLSPLTLPLGKTVLRTHCLNQPDLFIFFCQNQAEKVANHISSRGIYLNDCQNLPGRASDRTRRPPSLAEHWDINIRNLIDLDHQCIGEQLAGLSTK